MRSIKLLAALAAVVAAGMGGCMPPGASPRSTPVADPASYTPGGAPKFGYAVDYSSKVELAYEDTSADDDTGSGLMEAHLFTVRYAWYPQSIQDDDVPYALQPYMQRAGSISAGVGTGEVDFSAAGGPDDIDVGAFELGFAVFNTETGLGFRAAQRYLKYDDPTAGATDFGDDSLAGAIVWQDEKGFSAELALVKRSMEIYWEDLGFNFAAPVQTAYRAIGLGVRKVFLFDTQALDVSGSLEFGRFDFLKNIPAKTGSNVYRLGVTYYPVKMLGIGISYALRSFEDDSDLGGATMQDFESGEFAVNLALTVAERIDIGATYRSLEKDVPNGASDLNELSEFGVTVGVRF